MTTLEVAQRYVELDKQGLSHQIQPELYSDDCESIEPMGFMGGPQHVKGIEALREKAKRFGEMIEEVYSGYCSEPVVGGNFFSVAMGMDVKMKGEPRMQMDEIAVFEVKDGKIVKEQFFF